MKRKRGNRLLFFVLGVFVILVLAGFYFRGDSLLILDGSSPTGAVVYGAATNINCWDSAHSVDEAACEADFDCSWSDTPWGGWCEEKNCWSVFSETECGQASNSSSTSYINQTCSWQSGVTDGWCMELACWNYAGTNSSACVNNTKGLQCEWTDTYNAANWDYPCTGPWEKDCWTHTNQTSCTAVTGCEWGVCDPKSCWDYSDTTQANCEAQLGGNGKACDWKVYSWGTECMEGGCWSLENKTVCTADANCTWGGSYCSDRWCSDFSGVDSNTCVDNVANLSCSWDNTSKWCGDSGCWSYETQAQCGGEKNCFWETYTGGWCEEAGCWNYDSTNAATCVNNTANITCGWSDPWCDEDISGKSCADYGDYKDCLNNPYCFWNVTSSVCAEPVSGSIETEFDDWNPGCYLFDNEQGICTNTTGCDWNTTSLGCDNNITVLPGNALNCTLFTNRSVCNDIGVLGSCCKWTSGACAEDKYASSCWEASDPGDGAHYCEDYNAIGSNETCIKITKFPYLMPCMWNNEDDRCEFDHVDVFGDGEKNVMKLENEESCGAIGGKWTVDTYPSSNSTGAVKLSMGRCDYKFEDEWNCDKECYACEYQTSGLNWSDADKAKEACYESALGICEFTADTSADNSYGYCDIKTTFKAGLVDDDCNSLCAACTYYGNPGADSGYRASDYCKNSKAKCKWLADPEHPDDEDYGWCVSQAEKTCEDKCDKCYDSSSCPKYGGKEGNESVATVCEWDEGVCVYKSGADAMEICWDGVDNNGDNKVDCADGQCWSDTFCGGEYMFDEFGTDCFTFGDQTNCEVNSCAWINKTWGSWCDMPGAICWDYDGTNETWCETDVNGVTSNGTCEWHDGFGGFCEQDWDMGGTADTCMGVSDQATCGSTANCTWVVDDWCADSGGYCDPDPAYSGSWYNCVDHDWDGSAVCEASGTADGNGVKPCNWYVDSWCESQGDAAGYCDHKAYACWQYETESVCTNSTNTQWCLWTANEWGEYCEGKMMSGGSGSCWEQADQSSCTAANCDWIGGFCDPAGFGSDYLAGTGGGSAGGSDDSYWGGSASSCFKYDGNQTGCQNQTGCGWFEEQWPFCDVNFVTDCPQYSSSQTDCENTTVTGDRCFWQAEGAGGFCNEKPFECFTNSTLSSNQTSCEANSLCYWGAAGSCQPIGFNATTQTQCEAYNTTFFRWVTGWCNPAMNAEYFDEMDMSEKPVVMGVDVNDTNASDEVDIIDFGYAEMGETFGLGMQVDDMANAAACYGIKLISGSSGGGKNTSKYYWYLDTDGNTSGGCALRHDASGVGFEFYIKAAWTYDSGSGDVLESPAAYRCSNASWIKAEISVGSERHIMCDMVGGPMVAIEKSELEKFPSLYSAGTDLRVAVATAESGYNVTNVTDSASVGWISPGATDFEIEDLYEYESDAIEKAKKGASDSGYIDYGKDADCWTAAGCADYSCKGHDYCVANAVGVEATNWTDTRTPKVDGVVKEVYPDSAAIAAFTEKPANLTLKFYNNDSDCTSTSLNGTLFDKSINSTGLDNYSLDHMIEINEGTLGYNLTNDTAYYYKLRVCDEDGKCGKSKCSNFTTEHDQECAFCEYVARVDAPTGWDVHYDLDGDGDYEWKQGDTLNDSKDGVFVNYTMARDVNVLLNKSNSTASMEFLNVTLTKSGMNPVIRDVDESTGFKDGTTTTSAGTSIGYAGMIEDVRDKIVHNSFPEECRLTIPAGGTSCGELWHCDNDRENCVEKTNNATLINSSTASCEWTVPDCSFSVYAGGQPGSAAGAGGSPGSSGGGGSASGDRDGSAEGEAGVDSEDGEGDADGEDSEDGEEGEEVQESPIKELLSKLVSEVSAFNAMYAIIGVVALGILLFVFEFRHLRKIAKKK